MGSYAHAQSLKQQQIEAEAIILEMIGYFSENPIRRTIRFQAWTFYIISR